MEMSTLRTKRIEILKGMQGNSDSDAIFFFFFWSILYLSEDVVRNR